MKRTFILIIGLLSLICLSGCSTGDEQLQYGTYTFEEVSYLSPLSSNTVDYLNQIMAGTKYTITADSFKFKSIQNSVEINSPKYMEEELSNGSSLLFDVHTFFDNKVKHQYTIYDKAGNKTYWRLYLSSDCLWIASYNDNAANGSEIIMSIYKLIKE